jgi:hypothetical protein
MQECLQNHDRNTVIGDNAGEGEIIEDDMLS